MMAYGLGRNIALFQTSLYSFNHFPPPTSKRIKQKKLATNYKVVEYNRLLGEVCVEDQYLPRVHYIVITKIPNSLK